MNKESTRSIVPSAVPRAVRSAPLPSAPVRAFAALVTLSGLAGWASGAQAASSAASPRSAGAPPSLTRVENYTCRTVLEEPGDPTPVQTFRLARVGNTHTLTFKVNDALITTEQGLSCQFNVLRDCRFPGSTDNCRAPAASTLPAGTVEQTLLFRCSRATGPTPRPFVQNLFVPFVEINASGNVSTSRASVQIQGFNLAGQPEGILLLDYPSFACRATLR